ncbi:hypothetical protein EWH08_06840 [Sphingobium indicum]|uniref:Uncharacterized protein n=1 Tax=Sphingobium indicum TaxID=332055 RepID=A0A4Q4JD31_9SPHN|nr:hypothetical protein EWH08_06840 [Sphingobium indicum]
MPPIRHSGLDPGSRFSRKQHPAQGSGTPDQACPELAEGSGDRPMAAMGQFLPKSHKTAQRMNRRWRR